MSAARRIFGCGLTVLPGTGSTALRDRDHDGALCAFLEDATVTTCGARTGFLNNGCDAVALPETRFFI